MYQKLVGVLESGGFSWLVHEVAEQVSIGKINAPSSKDNKSKYEGADNIEYTPQERLKLLIEDAKYVIVNIAAMEEKMFSFFQQTSQCDIEAVEFCSELEENSIAVINSKKSADQKIHTQKAEEALNTLLYEVKKYEH